MNADKLRRRAVVIASCFESLEKGNLSLDDRIDVLRVMVTALEATKREVEAKKAEAKAVTP